ncbi:hypothetical protein X797_011130 [Metarhizium robertsii]|uniref:Uncharacterized protein n=2 Tax=Metarhizium robertsii TaxID=568076 RepID=E9FDZ0_METRA|nr:uncharacterized protein MAA_10489 [Metarhizium robertsii ARSEF 23]EFY94047.1 hypothetical protein MAA_10489 [Metarhizium robertsii ARSEF 23]EXU95779.1 hypothetical protein X797_011130 [Metarhizium robertsii]
MNRMNESAQPAFWELGFLASREQQRASHFTLNAEMSITHANTTLSYRHDGESCGWRVRDDDETIDPSILHPQDLPLWDVHQPFPPNHINSSNSAAVFAWPSDTSPPQITEYCFCDESEEEGCSWPGVADFIDMSLFDEDTLEALPHQVVPAAQLCEGPSDTIDREHFGSEMIKDAPCDIPDSADSACCGSAPYSTPDIRDSSDFTPPELQTPKSCSPLTPNKQATKSIEVIDLTGDEMESSLDVLDPEPARHAASGGVIERGISVVDLTQDDDEEKFGSWYDDNCDDTDYHYRSCYENQYRGVASTSDFPYPRTAANFVATGLLVDGRTYLWNHRCKQYRHGGSYAEPNHKNTAIVIRAGGGDIPIVLKYRGFGIWEGSNYRIGVAISEDAAKAMVFKRQSLSLKRKRGCMYSKDLFHSKRK